MGLFKEYITEVHYQDYYHENFEIFRKKYLKLLKKQDLSDYYVNFTNYTGDVIDKSIQKNPDHHDPIGIYGYPIEYVLKYPADVWYGSKAKYLRVLEHKWNSLNEMCRLQKLDYNDVVRHLAKIYKEGWFSAEEVYKNTAKWLRKWGNNSNASPGAVFFFNVQHDLSADPTYDKDGWTPKKAKFPERSGEEQSKILLSLGYKAILDEAKRQRKAIINDREPEQIIFLRRDAFDIIESYNLKQKSDYVGSTLHPEDIERKLVAEIARGMGDNIKEGPERSSLGGWSYYWTNKGRRIEVIFEWSNAWFKHMEATRRMGEKKHRENKLHDMKQTGVKIRTEYGEIPEHGVFTYDPDEKFKDIAADIIDEYKKLERSGKKDPIWRPQNKKQFLQSQEDARRLWYVKDQLNKFDKEDMNQEIQKTIDWYNNLSQQEKDDLDKEGYKTPTELNNEKELAIRFIETYPELKDQIIQFYHEVIMPKNKDLTPIKNEDIVKKD